MFSFTLEQPEIVEFFINKENGSINMYFSNCDYLTQGQRYEVSVITVHLWKYTVLSVGWFQPLNKWLNQNVTIRPQNNGRRSCARSIGYPYNVNAKTQLDLKIMCRSCAINEAIRIRKEKDRETVIKEVQVCHLPAGLVPPPAVVSLLYRTSVVS